MNVYPVPDGDTGTNMALTLESVVAELPDPSQSDLAAVCAAVSHGSLMGARGNSGVILSQILRGIAEAFRDTASGGQDAGEDEGAVGDAGGVGDAAEGGGAGGGGGATVADALARACAGAYQAVQRPVEGTILSVVKAASAAATASRGASLIEVLDAARAAAADALAATPDQLPVLKAAGVVDAGGAGFLLLLDAFLYRCAERPLPEPDAEVDVGSGTAVGTVGTVGAVVGRPRRPEAPAGASHDAVDLRYEVMYFLDAPDAAVGAFRQAWAGIGDSIVVVGGDGMYNCHIHTNDIGAALEAALDAGRPRDIRVTDLFEQVEEEQWVRQAAAGGQPAAARQPPRELAGRQPPRELAGCAVVAVTTGDGVRALFASLGVQQFVPGGQTMNPSTAELLAAIDAAPGQEVVILPNNKNIIPVAEQAARVAAKPASVVPTRGVTEGLAALMEYDPEATAEANAIAMRKAAARVVSGEVTVAVRSATSDAGPINAGDFLGLSGGTIAVVAPTVVEATEALLAKLLDGRHEIVTLIEGDAATKAETTAIADWLGGARPDLAVEVHSGGQPLYPYLLSIE
ncbi:MAG: DAK2 domain-containing protein [Acidimicrobiales bacterium]